MDAICGLQTLCAAQPLAFQKVLPPASELPICPEALAHAITYSQIEATDLQTPGLYRVRDRYLNETRLPPTPLSPQARNKTQLPPQNRGISLAGPEMPTLANPLANFGIFYRLFITGTKLSPSWFIGVGTLATSR
ncbi:hypothetical protein CcaCcLH18_12312 [Colletotrichum camelliae]|nr:hypothetical protein CcaCcLH18_12312 [Colletotrichum camelliae]